MALAFGEKIKMVRKAKKLTQKQLASKIGAAHNSISDWEKGKCKPDPDTIKALCRVLEITPNYLLATSSDDFSPAEKSIIKKYRGLDGHGKEMVDFTLEKEWERSTEEKKIVEMPEHLMPVAARERTDVEVTDEMRKHDDDIMNDPDF